MKSFDTTRNIASITESNNIPAPELQYSYYDMQRFHNKKIPSANKTNGEYVTLKIKVFHLFQFLKVDSCRVMVGSVEL